MSDVYKVLYTPLAYNDLSNIYKHIAFDLSSPDIGERQVSRIRSRITKLDIMPDRYETVNWEPWLSLGMHKMPVDNYVVFYSVDKESMSVMINRIFFSGREV